jgi:hypothetical protein
VCVVGLKSENVFHISDAVPYPVPGPMSEKDIKGIVLERCKDLGIKSSNRGLIAGTVCAGCTWLVFMPFSVPSSSYLQTFCSMARCFAQEQAWT